MNNSQSVVVSIVFVFCFLFFVIIRCTHLSLAFNKELEHTIKVNKIEKIDWIFCFLVFFSAAAVAVPVPDCTIPYTIDLQPRSILPVSRHDTVHAATHFFFVLFFAFFVSVPCIGTHRMSVFFLAQHSIRQKCQAIIVKLFIF